MPKHAILSASSSNMWLNCTPSIRASENIPDITSSYAEEGTLAHAIGEIKLRLSLKQINKKEYKEAVDFLTKNVPEEINIQDMLTYTQNYTDFVIEHFNIAKKNTTDAKLILEQKLDFSQWVVDGFGTGDAVIIADGSIEIIDLKYGKGVAVSAKNNSQLRLYALGAWNEYSMLYDIKTIAMTIYQPRLDSITTDMITVEELIKWAEDYVKPKADLAFNGDGEFVAGDHCKFCKIKSNCRANAYEKLKLARYEFQEPVLLSEKDISEILPEIDNLVSWASAIKDYALEQALKGIKYKGFKLVEGRSNRKYSTEENIIAEKLSTLGYAEDKIYIKKLLNITAMEKLMTKKLFDEHLEQYIIKPKGAPVLVPEADKRLELNSFIQAIEDFKS